MIELCDGHFKLILSHAEMVAALVEEKRAVIRYECMRQKGFMHRVISNLFKRNRRDSSHHNIGIQLAVIGVDSIYYSTINEALSSNNMDANNFEKLLQSLAKIEFKTLESSSLNDNETKQLEFTTENCLADYHIENEKGSNGSSIKSNYGEKQMTVIHSNTEDQRRFNHLYLNLEKSDPNDIDLKILRSQSLETFETRKPSVLQRSHSWMCASLASKCK